MNKFEDGRTANEIAEEFGYMPVMINYDGDVDYISLNNSLEHCIELS